MSPQEIPRHHTADDLSAAVARMRQRWPHLPETVTCLNVPFVGRVATVHVLAGQLGADAIAVESNYLAGSPDSKAHAVIAALDRLDKMCSTKPGTLRMTGKRLRKAQRKLKTRMRRAVESINLPCQNSAAHVGATVKASECANPP